MIPAARVILSDRASATLKALELARTAEAQAVVRRARAFKPVLLIDCLHGEVVRKGAIPRSLREKYDLENLYVEDLPSFWRLLYTIVNLGGERVIVVIEIASHKEYSRWFPGRHR